MMPQVFEDYFQLFGYHTSDLLHLKRLTTHYKIFLDHPLRTYAIKQDLKQNLNLFKQHEPQGDQKLKKFLHHSQTLYHQAMQHLILNDYHQISQLLNPATLKALLSFNLFQNYHQLTQKYFTNPDLQKILEFPTVFLGGSPYNTPSFYSLLAHTDFNLGLYHPLGGISTIITALTKLARQNHVTINTNEPVTHINIKNHQPQSVTTTQKTYPTNIVISSADYHHTETQLLDPPYQTHPEKTWTKKTIAPSAFLIYLGLKQQIKPLEHHNLYFNPSWQTHFRTVYKNPQWPTQPSYYVHVPTRTDSTLAPKGKDTLIILVPVAPDLKDTPQIRHQFSTQVIHHLSQLTHTNIQNLIQCQHIFAHSDFTSHYHAYQGTAFGLAHTLMQTGPFRPRNYSKKVKNLYYTGQYTNPGVGMPMAILSAQITANLI
jgi:phytoene desaturase